MRIVIDICKYCNKEFTRTGNSQKFCSLHCRNKGIQRRWTNKNPKKAILHGAKCRAKRDGLSFDIDEEDIDIPLICPILGIPIQKNVGSGWHNNSLSLDRINNSLGYIKGNVRIVSNRANRIKCDATLEELELILLDARSHRY